MAATAAAPTRAQAQTTADYWVLAKSFERSLWASNKSKNTIRIYTISVTQFGQFLQEQGMPMVVASIAREHVEEWMTALLKRSKPASVDTRHGGLKMFFKWALEEGEITRSPMERVKPPIIPEEPPQMLTDDQIKRLFKTCDGKLFKDRRDTAILRLLWDTGMRRSECAYLKLADVAFETNTAVITHAKGRRPRSVSFGRKTAQALDRYLRVRAQHRHADKDALWLGPQGPMGDGALDLMIRRRAKQAGLEHVHAHLFRHGFAHNWLANGGQERDLMLLAGWRSTEMLGRYGASAAAERAIAAHQRLNLGDRL